MIAGCVFNLQGIKIVCAFAHVHACMCMCVFVALFVNMPYGTIQMHAIEWIDSDR